MKLAKSILNVAILIALFGCTAIADPPTNSSAATPAPPAAVNQGKGRMTPLESIRTAPDPSAAVDAYARAIAALPNDVALPDAYIRRMVDFGLPEMADAQSQSLAKQDPHNGLAFAVVAYMNAKREKMPEALAAITVATKESPADGFVLKTAGQLLAWYDTKADQKTIPDETRQNIQALRPTVEKLSPYNDAYQSAREAYLGLSPAQPNATGPTTNAADTESVTIPQNIRIYDNPYVTNPPAVSYAPAPTYTQPWYPSDYYGYPYNGYPWWPSAASILIIRDHDGFHHQHHDNDGDHGHIRDLPGPRAIGSAFPPRTSLPFVNAARPVRENVPQRVQIPMMHVQLPSIERRAQIQASPHIQSVPNQPVPRVAAPAQPAQPAPQPHGRGR